jgi:hypothetical protein
MKIGSVILSTLVLLIVSFSVSAQDISKESFYRSCVDKALNKFERKTANIESERPAIKRDAAVATLKVEFIKSHKDQLIQQMCSQNLDTNQADVDYFLTTSFGAFMGANLNQAVADLMEGAGDVYEAYSEEEQ